MTITASYNETEMNLVDSFTVSYDNFIYSINTNETVTTNPVKFSLDDS